MKNQSIAWNPTMLELPVPAGTYTVGAHSLQFRLPDSYDNGSIPESTDTLTFCECDMVTGDADRSLFKFIECRSLSSNRVEFNFVIEGSSWAPSTTTRFYFLVVKRGVFHFNVTTFINP